MTKIVKIITLGVLSTVIAAFYMTGTLETIISFLSFDSLKANHETLTHFVTDNFLLSLLIFIGSYAAVVALSIPGASILTLLGGFLFGFVTGTISVVIGATIGATVIFILAKTFLRDFFKAKLKTDNETGVLSKFEAGFKDNALSYLLVLRLVPLFPFWLVNIVPAIFGVGTLTYIITTFIGIIPGSAVYVSLGGTLDHLIASGQEPNLGIIFDKEILFPLLGLALLAMAPAVYKKMKRK